MSLHCRLWPQCYLSSSRKRYDRWQAASHTRWSLALRPCSVAGPLVAHGIVWEVRIVGGFCSSQRFRQIQPTGSDQIGKECFGDAAVRSLMTDEAVRTARRVGGLGTHAGCSRLCYWVFGSSMKGSTLRQTRPTAGAVRVRTKFSGRIAQKGLSPGWHSLPMDASRFAGMSADYGLDFGG